MKISWLSNAPWSATGYGNQTKVFAPRLKKLGHDIQITAFYGLEGGILAWNDIPIFPRAYHPYGMDIAGAHGSQFGADVIISLIDVWVCDGNMISRTGIPWIPWFPIDSEPVSPFIVEKCKPAFKRLMFSKHGCAMLDRVGIDYDYIPHGVDTGMFRPMDMTKCREAHKLPQDAFIVGLVAANKGNPSRKAFDSQIAGFAGFHQKHPDSILVIHSKLSQHGEDQGVNLVELCDYHGLQIGKDVLFPDQYHMLVGFPDQHMASLYNTFDVKMLVSQGEGFGIPIVEAQACGVPVIVGDWTANAELCFSGWKIPKTDAVPTWTPLGTYQYHAHPGAVTNALEQAYEVRGNQQYRSRARDGALAYDADKIVEKYWRPYLDKLAVELADLKSHPAHVHTWAKIGLYNRDGSISTPCTTCDDELVNGQKVIKDGFKPVFKSGVELKLVPDDDGISKIVCREIERDYDLDGLDLKPGDVVLDIGAHKGIVSCYLAKRYPGVVIRAYEPNHENYKVLCENIVLNGADVISTVSDFEVAVTKDGRSVALNVDSSNSGSGTLAEGDLIKSFTLADVFENDNKIALLKIDCEGAEFEILQANPDLLDRVDHIRGEFHKSYGDVDALIALCKEHCPDVKVTVQG